VERRMSIQRIRSEAQGERSTSTMSTVLPSQLIGWCWQHKHSIDSAEREKQ